MSKLLKKIDIQKFYITVMFRVNIELIPFIYQYCLIKATFVILTKEESYNNSNISEQKMQFFHRQTRA